MKFKHILPYILILIITPFYNILDSTVIVNYFGCGCVPSVQSNYFNIDFNANDMRQLVYTILTVITTIMGITASKDMDKKPKRIGYIILVFASNVVLSMLICMMHVWK